MDPLHRQGRAGQGAAVSKGTRGQLFRFFGGPEDGKSHVLNKSVPDAIRWNLGRSLYRRGAGNTFHYDPEEGEADE